MIQVGSDRESIKNLKFLLCYFEWMSGLKINYHKSEVVVFGCSDEQTQEIANSLNCKVGHLPMTYLGFPISAKNLGLAAFRGVVEKMWKKLLPWKRKHLSSGGRLILTNSSLGVFSSRKVREKVVVARFGFIWQLLSNHEVISLKRFVSSFTTKLCN